MPFIESQEEQSLFSRLIPEETPETDAPFSQKLKAAFQIDNTLGAYISKEDNLPDFHVENKEYNPWDDLTPQEQLDSDFVDNALFADNRTELEAVRRQVSMEREARSKLTGVDGVLASMAAGIADPINLVPFGGAAFRVYKTGSSILRAGVTTASVAGVSAAAQEAALHSQQLERTFGESAINVTGAALLGMALGSGVGAFSQAQYRTLVRETEEFMDLANPAFKIEDAPLTSQSVGAAATVGDVRVKGKMAEKITKALGFDPLSRTITGKSQEARKLLSQLAENPIDMEGFSGTAVESLAKVRRDSLLYRGLRAHSDVFKEYKKAGGKLKRRHFNELVSRELRNPGAIDDPHVQRSAQAWKKEVYDPQFRDIVDARMLPEDVEVTTAKQYLNRVWNKEKLAADLPRFIDITSSWLIKRQPDIDADDAAEIATEIAGRIMSSSEGMLPYNYKMGGNIARGGKKLKGPFQSRVFDIEDNLVEEFLDNDIEKLAGRYLRQTSTDIEIVKRFGDDKTPAEDVINFTREKKAIEEEYLRMMERAKTEKERLGLQKEMKRARTDIDGIIDRMRSVYEPPDPNSITHRIMHAARNLAFLRFMGGVTISSFPDAARVITTEGFTRAFGTAMRPLIRGVKANKPAVEDVKYWGIGTDAITGGRLEVISDINDYALGGTAVERGLQSMANSYSNINLMNQWTGFMKTTHAISMQTRVMDTLNKGVYDSRLGRLGISESDAFQIRDQVKKYGKKDGNAWIYNAKDWDRQDLALQWAAALKKESDRVIIVPGQERPLFMSRQSGKTILQFKSFMMAATQRVLIAGIQGQDAHLIQGLTSMVTAGAMTYAFKQWEAGREISDDPKQWVIEGIDRSGALGILMEANNTVEKVSANNLGLRPLFGVSSPASRYASRSAQEALMGPTFGSTVSTTMRVLGAASADYEWSEGDTSALRRLIPYQNLSIIRKGFDKIEETANEALD